MSHSMRLIGLALCLVFAGCAIEEVPDDPASYAWESRISEMHRIISLPGQSILTGSRTHFALVMRNGDLSSFQIHWRVSAGQVLGPLNQQDVVWETPATGPAWIGVELRRDGESWIACQRVDFADEQLELLLEAGAIQPDGYRLVTAVVECTDPTELQLSWGCSGGTFHQENGPFDVRWGWVPRGPQQVWCRASNGHVERSDTLYFMVPNLAPVLDMQEPEPMFCGYPRWVVVLGSDHNGDPLQLEVSALDGLRLDSLQLESSGDEFTWIWSLLIVSEGDSAGMRQLALSLADDEHVVERTYNLWVDCD